ncbi:glycoside hydrolase family 15 protein [Salinisphaera sp. LB1]|uniref:glycoside hydrolase family 15 protein n=1 Tax=Salinisphaera sp. LB1 TaxID=2183911 RepID=UPI000D707533|nr:glycoside hydrolase family 15 protein [Salinisphaera sp. LB1]
MAGADRHHAEDPEPTADLNLGLIGNGQIAALVDTQARIVWGCFPDFQGDPLFSRLLDDRERGYYAIGIDDCISIEREYLRNTAILQTTLRDAHGGAVQLTDFAPHFWQYGREFRPLMIVRQITHLAGTPRVRVRMRPVCNYGADEVRITRGSNHLRYVSDARVLRLTTDVPISYVLEERAFVPSGTYTLVAASDETLLESPADVGRRFFEQTRDHWRNWVRTLSIPFDWQQAVIRSAITLKLSTYTETGAVVAAMTTSIPEAAHSERNWDYRHCWLRDSYFVIRALNRLGATSIMENYLHYIINLVANAEDNTLQPVYGINGEAKLTETRAGHLAGYRGMGPVRVGNDAYRQVQHDVYGSVILAITQIFFDERLSHLKDEALFRHLEPLGEKALANYRTPDAGIWEYRGRERIHTHSALLCWVACDRLARIARHLGLDGDARRWQRGADEIHAAICDNAWSATRNSFVESFGGEDIDAALLLMNELSFLPADDPRFIGTVEAVGETLKRGDYLFRYAADDDFGTPENAFNICTFWYIEALSAIGRTNEAQQLFHNMLEHRSDLGMLSEDIDPQTGELWGNYPQTYSMVGIINAALHLSRRWEEVL